MGRDWLSSRRRRTATAILVDRPALAGSAYALGINETARQVGCSGATVSMLASGKRAGCSVYLASEIARVLLLDLNKVFRIETVGQTERDVRPDSTQEQKSA